MKKIIIILSIIFSISEKSVSQCGFVLMHDTSSEYFSQLTYVEETTWGFRTYMRKYFNPQEVDDPRNGIYVQERDECMNLVDEQMFLRVIDIPNRVFHPRDWLQMFTAWDTNYLWVSSGSIPLYLDKRTKSIEIYPRYDNWLDMTTPSLIEFEKGRFGYSFGSGGGFQVMDSLFKNKMVKRSCVSALNQLDSGRLFFAYLPDTIPLFTADSSIFLMDVNGNVNWEFRFGKTIPGIYDWHFSKLHYYLIGTEDIDGNRVAYNPVIYKLDKEGKLILKKFVNTNQFRASIGTRVMVARDCLYMTGWQTISRRPSEVKQNFIAKLDLDLNLIWKIDLDQVCGPRTAVCTSIKQTKDGGALFTYLRVPGADTCNPLFVKVDPNGVINSVVNHSRSEEYIVQPNPVSDEALITGSDLPIDATVELVDLMGNRFTVTADNSRIDMSHLPKGIYFLRIRIKDQADRMIKLVKI